MANDNIVNFVFKIGPDGMIPFDGLEICGQRSNRRAPGELFGLEIDKYVKIVARCRQGVEVRFVVVNG